MAKRVFQVSVVVASDDESDARAYAQVIVLHAHLATGGRDATLRGWVMEELVDGEAKPISECVFAPDYKLEKSMVTPTGCLFCGKSTVDDTCSKS